MTPEEARAEFIRQAKENKRVDFFGRMYGTHDKNDKILDMNIHEGNSVFDNKFDDVENWDYFAYIWGWPGPDYNTYYFRDYGQTWAFSIEDFEE